MVHAQCFTKGWLKRQAEAIGSRNPVMLEKAIVALQLLGHLAESGLPIQFKGGTSLLLRLNPVRRLSIDVDIVTQAKPEELVAALGRASRIAPLAGYEHDARRDKQMPPKKHFRFYYPSAIEPKTDHVLLDALFEPQAAPHCEPVIINTAFITQDGVSALQNHLVNQPFRRDEARIAAAKVACIAAWIQRRPAGVTIEQLRFQSDRAMELRDLQIRAPWSALTRLKGGNAQAFHYWYQAQRILTGYLTPEKNKKRRIHRNRTDPLPSASDSSGNHMQAQTGRP
jgi:hypothetical protein